MHNQAPVSYHYTIAKLVTFKKQGILPVLKMKRDAR